MYVIYNYIILDLIISNIIKNINNCIAYTLSGNIVTIVHNIFSPKYIIPLSHRNVRNRIIKKVKRVQS